ncbi:basic membrane lipoprotein [Catenulispora acidiphila DSM 44928]|uniref:Basic membrane lipoprotein n=2 Tax=Catenulispora TaxID=414878 RepID=C7Q0T9_CATAD|nr:basic membrane lipoprotein [Catenulispora acidiphila DSM 44928]
MRTTNMTRIAAAAAVVALAAAGCGSKSTPAASSSSSSTGTSSSSSASSSSSTSGSASNANFLACMVTDTGGIDDRSFNASAWLGMQDAQKDGKATVKYLQSSTENDYVPNITQLEGQNCKLIVTVGGLMADATDSQAAAKTGQNFAIVDNGSADTKTNKPIANVHGMEFNTAQGGFLAGYLAAASSKSGVVATWGGLNIPPVTIYMDGFWEGVQYYNHAKSKSVKVLGWDETNPSSGTFSNSFTDTNKGKSITDGFINQGADIVFPVAGGAGRGATASAKAGKAKVIWVDSDGCVSDSEDCSVFLASVTKGIETAVKKVVEDAAAGNFKGGTQDVLDLSNGGTDLVYGQQLGSSIPSDLQSQITALKAQITGGTIKITSPSQPK